MRRLVMLAVAVALAVPVAAAATGSPDRAGVEKESGKKAWLGSGVFASVAEQVCRERLRPFLASDDAEKAVDEGKGRCARKLLRHEWKLARAVLVCTERLAEAETLNRRTLSECLVSVLLRKGDAEKQKAKDAEKAAAEEKRKAKQAEAQAFAAAAAACKEEAADPGFAEAHEGLSFVEFYAEGDEVDEYHALKRCVQSRLETSDG